LTKSGIFTAKQDEDVDDGAGTGGVGGLFSMTITEEEEAKVFGHFEENPFGEDEEVQPVESSSPQVPLDPTQLNKGLPDQADGQEGPLIEQADNAEDTPSHVEQADNAEDTSSHVSENLGDWQEIDFDYFDKLGVRAPDFMTDPFKEKWNHVKG